MGKAKIILIKTEAVAVFPIPISPKKCNYNLFLQSFSRLLAPYLSTIAVPCSWLGRAKRLCSHPNFCRNQIRIQREIIIHTRIHNRKFDGVLFAKYIDCCATY
jgi:hypothetical protein